MEGERGSSWRYFPLDMLVHLSFPFILIPVALIGSGSLYLTNFPRLTWGIALGFAGIGSGLLFWARLPLYRQRRFFSFGAAALDSFHKRLYRAAYVLIGAAVFLFLLLCVFGRR